MSSAVLPVFYPANLCEPLTLGSNGIVTDIVYDRLLGAVSSRCRRTKPDVSSVLLASFFPVLQFVRSTGCSTGFGGFLRAYGFTILGAAALVGALFPPPS